MCFPGRRPSQLVEQWRTEGFPLHRKTVAVPSGRSKAAPKEWWVFVLPLTTFDALVIPPEWSSFTVGRWQHDLSVSPWT